MSKNLLPWPKRIGPMCKSLLRFVWEQTLQGDVDSPPAAGGLLVNAMNVAAEHEAEFNEWDDHEHMPALPVVLVARRFRALVGMHRHLEVYHLKTHEVAMNGAWKSGAASAWTDRLRPHSRDLARILSRQFVRGA